MKTLLKRFCVVAVTALSAMGFTGAIAATVPVAAPKTLILYDAPAGTEFEKLGMGYAIMLKNLISHFNSDAELMPVQNYVAGKVNAYDATFYMGSYYDNPVPKALMVHQRNAWRPLHFVHARPRRLERKSPHQAATIASSPAPTLRDRHWHCRTH